MDYRKIIKFGNSSHVISLPSKWLEKNKLNKGDVVYYEENGNGELIVSPTQLLEDNKSKEITIDITDKDSTQIQREINIAYVNDYNLMRITGKDLSKSSNNIRNFLHNLVALEIMEQTSSRIVAKDFLNIENASIKNLIRKMDIIARGMISDTIGTMELEDSQRDSQIENIIGRDLDVNRLMFLIFRVIKKCAKNQKLANKLGLTTEDLINNWRLTFDIETIADEVKRISRFLKDMKKNKEEEKELLGLLSLVEDSYLTAMKALHTDNKNLAFEVAMKKKIVYDSCNVILGKYYTSVIASKIIEKIKSVERHTGDIARIIYARD